MRYEMNNLILPIMPAMVRIHDLFLTNAYGKYTARFWIHQDDIDSIKESYSKLGYDEETLMRQKMTPSDEGGVIRMSQGQRRFFDLLNSEGQKLDENDVVPSRPYPVILHSIIGSLKSKPNYHVFRQTRVKLMTEKELEETNFKEFLQITL